MARNCLPTATNKWRLVLLIYTLLSVASNLGHCFKNRSVPYSRVQYEIDSVIAGNRHLKELTYAEKSASISYRTNSGLNRTEVVKYYEHHKGFEHEHFFSEDNIIMEAFHQTYITRLLQPLMFTYDKHEDKVRASDKNVVSYQDKCKADMAYIMRNFHELQEARLNQTRYHGINPEFLAFLDSFGGQESNMVLGNFNWLGDYRECVTRLVTDYPQSTTEPMISFRGRYCVARIKSNRWDPIIDEYVNELNASNYFKQPDQHYVYRQFFRINLGICLPESCDSLIDEIEPEIVSKTELVTLIKHKLNRPYSSYNITSIYCLPDETSELRQIEWPGVVFLSLIAAWLTLIVLSTVYNHYKKSKHFTSDEVRRQQLTAMEKLTESVSLIECFKSYKRASLAIEGLDADRIVRREPPSLKDLYFLHSFKVLLMLGVLWGHISMMALWFSTSPLEAHPSWILTYHLHISLTFNVDWFFTMSGFTVAYMVFIQGQAAGLMKLGRWLYVIFHRYCRLAPIYLFLFWFARTLTHLTSQGPLWDYKTHNATMRNMCQQEPLIVPFTLSTNLIPMYRECIGTAWYIGNDFQFVWITPPLLYFLAKKPIVSYLISNGLILFSILARIYRILNEPSVKPFNLLRPRADMIMLVNWDLDNIYFYPQYRIAPYLIGIMCGHYVYMVRSGQWKSPFYSAERTPEGAEKAPTSRKNLYRAILGYFGIYISIYSYLSTFISETTRQPESSAEALYNVAIGMGLQHTMAAIGPAAIFTAILFGQWHRTIKWFCNRSFWGYLANINYFVYLAQVEFIVWILASDTRQPETTNQTELRMYSFLWPMLYACSFIMHLLVSLPINRLERAFVGNALKSRSGDSAAHHQELSRVVEERDWKSPSGNRNNNPRKLDEIEPSAKSGLLDGNLPTSDNKADAIVVFACPPADIDRGRSSDGRTPVQADR